MPRSAFAALVCVSLLASSPALALDEEFAANQIDTSVWFARTPLDGARILNGRASALALDGREVRLFYPGGRPSWEWGPRWATQLMTRTSSAYGSYEVRMRSANAAAGDGMISAFFTYFNDGTDRDGDGLIDNHEIDIELPNTERGVIYLSVWTEYDYSGDEELFHRVAARIDVRTGRVWVTPPGGYGAWDLVRADDLPFADSSFNHRNAYYTYGFDWQTDRVDFWIDLEDGAGRRALWSVAGSPDVEIPSLASPTFLNLWRTTVNWWTRASATAPASDTVFRVDYLRTP